MAAEVDFGDRELFEQLDADEPAATPGPAAQPLHIRFDEETEELRERLRECQETVKELQAENRELRRKLKILTRPSGLTVDDSKYDGPLLQILFMNNTISKQYHQEIEDFISSLVQRYEEQQRAEPDKTYFNVKPQPSSFVLEDDHKVTCPNPSKKMKEAFSVIGSVFYFTNFCLDKLGQPILNENPQLTDGWEIPKYQQVFTQILSLDGQEIQVKPKRPKPHCFNCGCEDHQMKDCPQPRNAARINEKRKEFMEAYGEASNQNFQQRYHAEEIEERFGRFRPGIISEELQDALGVTEKTLPPFIYRMRQLGYPPGWLREAENEKSGLTLYDGQASPGGETVVEECLQQNRHVSYDVSKLVNYPGFNICAPSGVTDEWRMFGSVPMQPSQQKDIFAHYLSTYRSASPKSSHKRPSPHQGTHNPKKQKRNNTEVSPADMEIDSDLEMLQGSPRYDGFQFQPPLPPGSPMNATPPPLPRGTPPCTPPNFTPPQPPPSTPPPLPQGTSPSNTPNDSASVRIENEDTLTLEELEEQQRLIWAALEQADSANSDSEIPAGTPLTGNSVASSPLRTESEVLPEDTTCKTLDGSGPGPSDDTELIPTAEQPEQTLDASGPGPSDDTELIPTAEQPEQTLDASGPGPSDDTELIPTAEQPEEKQSSADEMVVDLTGGEEEEEGEPPGRMDFEEDVAETCPSVSVCEVSQGEEGGSSPAVSSMQGSSKNASPVPDMSKFAEGITPFEFDNMAESTGIYLRIRSVLKNSPRNQQKNNKPPL
ncbi:PREDICTED: zinc finger CCHC domain-containing protein 8 isoform X2 [Gekko japonicus]|uniref:Zinc finger CCHC domain-containing protein 8 n=1 Tax=Gekko japonicus TaxID=146911 RepID=A0ABM1KHF5_GEKJA|nr:PREDICTED: zinc finger CCHC domain-containing protein 8 isoform X2 [Gekko japonicus]